MVLSRTHPEDRPGLEDAVYKAIREASDLETEYRIILEDGSIRHIHTLGHPVKNAGGNLGGVRWHAYGHRRAAAFEKGA
jgi:PAS domain-containing protein